MEKKFDSVCYNLLPLVALKISNTLMSSMLCCCSYDLEYIEWHCHFNIIRWVTTSSSENLSVPPILLC